MEKGIKPDHLQNLIYLRAEWIYWRDTFSYQSKEWWRLHFGIYALDEAIYTLEEGKVTRHADFNRSLDFVLKN